VIVRGGSVSGQSRLIKVDGERLGYVPSFDGMRGLTVMGVLFFHAEVTGFLAGTPVLIDWFFVASGFLITTLLLDERSKTGGVSLKNFYIRRVLRLFPAMYAMLGVILLLFLAVRLLDPSALNNYDLWWLEIVGAATYTYYLIAAIVPGQIAGVIGHVWTLTVEEHFYLIWPLLLLATLRRASRRSDRNLIIGCVVFIAVMVSIRVGFQSVINFSPAETTFNDVHHVTWQGVIYRIAAFRPDSIVIGCLAAFIAKAVPRPVPQTVRRWLAVLGPISWVLFVAVLLFAGRVPGFDLFGGPVYQLAILGLVPLTLDLYLRPETPYARLLSIRPFRWLGVRSYGIYLWHVPVVLPFLAALSASHGMQRITLGLIVACLGVGVGALSFRFIERPFLRLKETRYRKTAEQREYSEIERERETLTSPSGAPSGDPDELEPTP
jgi:peptidoglycan/LPS O-acetylase OafA/YrhL